MSDSELESKTGQGSAPSTVVAGQSIHEEPNPADYGVNPGQLLRKIDFRIVPGVTFLYLLSFLDRANIANARIEGLIDQIDVSPDEYLTGLSLFFIGYISLEVVWNIILKRIGPKAWLPAITIVWGIVTTLQGTITNRTGFYVIRTALGVAEGGLFPGVVFYLSQWYRRDERQFRVALFFSAASLAGSLGGILAFGIAKMNGIGNKPGWAWIFILEGLLTVVAGFAGYWFVADWPTKGTFLKEKEKAYVIARLKADSDATNDEGFSWHNVISALKDPKCWLYGLVFHTLSLPLYTLSLFLPSIITALGYSSANAQLLTIPPYALATVLCVVYAIVSERYKRRAPFIILSSSIAIIGYIILLANKDPKANPAASYVGVFFAAAGIYPSVALGLSWPAINVSGQTKRAVANGLQITVGNIAATFGVQLYRNAFAPRYVPGHATALGYLVGNIVVVSLLAFILRRENKRREALPESKQDKGEWRGDDDTRWRFTY